MFSLEACVLIALVLVALYYYSRRGFNYWAKRGVKYEEPAPFVGNILDAILMKRQQGQIVSDIYKKYENEKVVGIFNLNYPALIIRDPELVYKIYVSDFNSFTDNEIEVDANVDGVLSRNMFTQKGEKWKKTRQSISPAFSISKIKTAFDAMIPVAENLSNYLGNNPGEVHLKDTLARYTSEIVAACGLGIDGHAFTPSEPDLVRIGKMIFDPALSKGLTQLIIFIAPTLSKLFKLRMVPKEVPEYFDNILMDIIDYRQRNSHEKHNDIIQHWIDLKNKSIEVMKGNIKSDVITKEFTDDDIVGGCVTFFVEAFETSSLVMSSILYHLALNRGIQDKAKAEVEEMWRATNGKPTFEAVTNMTYLTNLIYETLRIHPALYNSSKVCTKEYALDIGKSKPLIIEKGVTVILPTFGLNTDSKYWDNPDKFDPDRFTDDDKSSRPKGVFAPFGDGPRVCIGIRMAHTLIKLGLAYILKDFEVVPTERTPKKFIQDPRHFMACHKGGIYAKFVKRR